MTELRCGEDIYKPTLAFQRLPDALGNPVDGREDHVFENVGGGEGVARGRGPDRRAVEIVDSLVSDNRDELRAPAAGPGVFLYSEETVRAGDRAEDRLRVERHKGAHIDHFAVDARFRMKTLGGCKLARNHQGERQ